MKLGTSAIEQLDKPLRLGVSIDAGESTLN